MQRFTYTLLLLIATLTYTACVSDSTPDNTPEKVPAPVVVEKPTPKPEPTPPPVEEKKPTPPPAPKPTPSPTATKPVTPPPTPKPAPASAPTPAPQPVNNTQKVVTPPPPPPPPPIPTGGGKMTFDNRTLDYGYIEEGTVINHTFKFKNTGTTAINILNADVSCGCTYPTYSFLPIEPGKTGEIGVRFDSKGKLGVSKSTVTLLTDARPAKQELFLTGTVIPPRKEKEEEEKEGEEKEEEKTDEKDTETVENKTAPKPDSLNFKPRGPRKLPKGIPPKTQQDEDDTGKN